MKRFASLITFVLLVLNASVGNAQSTSTYRDEYRLSTVLNASFPWGQAAERWAELIREKTHDRIKIRIFHNASLVSGDQTREFIGLRQGIIDLAIGSTINWSSQVKELNLFSLPFLISNHRGIDILTHGEVGRDLFKVLEKNGVVPLAWGENGFRELSNSKKVITSPIDMKGLRFRVVGLPIFADIFRSLGAKPVLMGWSEVQAALAAKSIEGQENPISVFTAARMYDLDQKYLTLWRYAVDPLVFVVNQSVWSSWSEIDRQAVQVAALQAAQENIQRSRQGLATGEQVMVSQLGHLGVQIAVLNEEQRVAFIEATRPVYDKWAKLIGLPLVRKAEFSLSQK